MPAKISVFSKFTRLQQFLSYWSIFFEKDVQPVNFCDFFSLLSNLSFLVVARLLTSYGKRKYLILIISKENPLLRLAITKKNSLDPTYK